jgi:hypothetical protein
MGGGRIDVDHPGYRLRDLGGWSRRGGDRLRSLDIAAAIISAMRLANVGVSRGAISESKSLAKSSRLGPGSTVCGSLSCDTRTLRKLAPSRENA